MCGVKKLYGYYFSKMSSLDYLEDCQTVHPELGLHLNLLSPPYLTQDPSLYGQTEMTQVL